MAEGPEPPQFATAEEIREFIARYGRPYDAETDEYDRPAFVSDIKEGKNDPIYNAHRAAEEFDETAATDDDQPHQLGERARALYEQMTPLFQGVLKEHVDAKLYALASRQVRTASRKLQHHQEARQAAEEATKTKPDAQKRLF